MYSSTVLNVVNIAL